MVVVRIVAAGFAAVNGMYDPQLPKIIPAGFALTCNKMRWDPENTWRKLSDLTTTWYEMQNGSYIYYNRNDGNWWIDGPDGDGIYIAKTDGGDVPPQSGWRALRPNYKPLPTIEIVDDSEEATSNKNDL